MAAGGRNPQKSAAARAKAEAKKAAEKNQGGGAAGKAARGGDADAVGDAFAKANAERALKNAEKQKREEEKKKKEEVEKRRREKEAKAAVRHPVNCSQSAPALLRFRLLRCSAAQVRSGRGCCSLWNGYGAAASALTCRAAGHAWRAHPRARAREACPPPDSGALSPATRLAGVGAPTDTAHRHTRTRDTIEEHRGGEKLHITLGTRLTTEQNTPSLPVLNAVVCGHCS